MSALNRTDWMGLLCWAACLVALFGLALIVRYLISQL